MRTMRLYGALALIVVGSFVLDGCLRGDVVREEVAAEEFGGPPLVRVGISAGLGVPQLTLDGRTVRAAGDALEVDGVRAESPLTWDGPAQFGGRSYRGSLEIVLRDGKLDLVNVVPSEDYLAGVVGKEMNLSWPEAALKAQVIAARTYALYEIRHGGLRALGLPFDVFDDERSQVYGGTERESSGARKLVDETRGMVLRWNGKVIKAYYASTCGGATDAAADVLRHPSRIPPLGGATCGFCEGTKNYAWTMKPLPLDEVARRLGYGRVTSVAAGRRLPSGRVVSVEVVTDRGPVTLDANDEFRRKIDPRQIRSTLWDELAVRDGALHLAGRGWGHGAGMCQTGAHGMAQAGRTAAQILGHYYPGAALEKIY